MRLRGNDARGEHYRLFFIMMKIFILFSLLLLPLKNASAGPEDDIRITVSPTSLSNSDSKAFIHRCIEAAPNYYRHTILREINDSLQNPCAASQKVLAPLCAYDHQTLLGWYKIEETNPMEKTSQISGLLNLEGDLSTGCIEVHLMYLPQTLRLSNTSLTPKVLDWAKEHINPYLRTSVPFLSGLDENLLPLFKETQVQGICAPISCWNYPSLITTTRAGFKIACLMSPSLRGHEYCLIYPPPQPEIPNQAIEQHLRKNPGMPELVTRAQRGLDLLEKRETREQGKHILKDVYYRYSGIDRITRIGVTAAIIAIATWWYWIQ